jgi:hypothetical protein
LCQPLGFPRLFFFFSPVILPPESTTYQAIQRVESVMMRVFEILKPAFNARIHIGNNLIDRIASGPASPCADFVLRLLKTLSTYIATTRFKPISELSLVGFLAPQVAMLQVIFVIGFTVASA